MNTKATQGGIRTMAAFEKNQFSDYLCFKTRLDLIKNRIEQPHLPVKCSTRKTVMNLVQLKCDIPD